MQRARKYSAEQVFCPVGIMQSGYSTQGVYNLQNKCSAMWLICPVYMQRAREYSAERVFCPVGIMQSGYSTQGVYNLQNKCSAK